MSISLNNHEQRITALENISKSSKSYEILNKRTSLNGQQIITFNITPCYDYDFIYIAFDCWGDHKPNATYNSVDERLMPMGLIKNMWCQSTQMYSGQNISGQEGLALKIDTNKILSVKQVGYEFTNAVWKIIALKIYYIFRYNIYKMLKLISPILKF